MVVSVIVDADGAIPIPEELWTAMGRYAGMRFVVTREGTRLVLEPVDPSSPTRKTSLGG